MTIPKLSVLVVSLCLFLHGLAQAQKKQWPREMKMQIFGFLAQGDTAWHYRIVKPMKKGNKDREATIAAFEFQPLFPDIYSSGQFMQDKVDCYANFLDCILQKDTAVCNLFDFHF